MNAAALRKLASKSLATVKAEKMLSQGMAFLGDDALFGEAVLIIKWNGYQTKLMGGSPEHIAETWNSITPRKEVV